MVLICVNYGLIGSRQIDDKARYSLGGWYRVIDSYSTVRWVQVDAQWTGCQSGPQPVPPNMFIFVFTKQDGAGQNAKLKASHKLQHINQWWVATRTYIKSKEAQESNK